jgi:hypothetical protein
LFAVLMEDEKARGVRARTAYIAGARFCVVGARLTGVLARARLGRAARLMSRSGMSRCVFPKDFAGRAEFSREGVEAVDTSPLYAAAAPAAAELALAKKGIRLRDAGVAVAGESALAEAALAELAPKARAASLYSLGGCARLCERLRAESGVSVRRLAPENAECGADLLISYGGSPVDGRRCAVWIKAGKRPGEGGCAANEPSEIVFDVPEEMDDDDVRQLDAAQLMSALMQAGALRPDALKVADIRFLLDTE